MIIFSYNAAAAASTAKELNVNRKFPVYFLEYLNRARSSHAASTFNIRRLNVDLFHCSARLQLISLTREKSNEPVVSSRAWHIFEGESVFHT